VQISWQYMVRYNYSLIIYIENYNESNNLWRRIQIPQVIHSKNYVSLIPFPQIQASRLLPNTLNLEDSKGFWRWCIMHRISGFLDFPIARYSRNWICFRPQVRGRRHLLSWVPLRLALSKGPNWAGVSSPSPENGNVVFPCSTIPDDGQVQKPSHSDPKSILALSF
jgi:hypothetical protein